MNQVPSICDDDLGQVISSLWASIYLSVKQGLILVATTSENQVKPLH